MSKNTSQLYFDYPSTSKIRIKKEHCLVHDNYPFVYRILTNKLDFVIPKHAVIVTHKYVYISLSNYRQALNGFYSSIKKC